MENEGCASRSEVAMVGASRQGKPCAATGWMAFVGELSGVYFARDDAESLMRLLLLLEHLHRSGSAIDDDTNAKVKDALAKFQMRGLHLLRPLEECVADESEAPKRVLRIANSESVEQALTAAARANDRLDALVRRLGEELGMYDWSEAL